MITGIISIVAIFLVLSLRSRVEKLEELVTKLSSGRALTPNQATPQNPNSDPTKIEELKRIYGVAENKTMLTVTPAKGDDVVDQFTKWFKEDWLLKLGVIILLIGFGWFTTYAFANNWIGPGGRIALGIIAGAISLIIGSYRIRTMLHQGGAFLVLGSTTVLLTIYAAREVYGFFTPITALAVMFLSTVFVAFASVKYNNRALSLASLALAGIAPLLSDSPMGDYTHFFAYLIVVTLGAIWVTALTGRRELTTAALIIVGFYSLPHLVGITGADKGEILLYMYAFSSIFFLSNIAGILHRKSEEITADVATAALNGLHLLAWIMYAAQDEWQSLIITAWMIVFTVAAFAIFKATSRKEPFYTYAAVAIAMLAAATSEELSGASLTIAYAIESALVSIVTFLILRDIRVAAKASLLLMGPIVLSVQSILGGQWYAGILNRDFFVLVTLCVTTLIVGAFFRDKEHSYADKEVPQIGETYTVIGTIYILILIWKCLHGSALLDETATMISLVIYTIIGVATYFYGKSNSIHTVKIYGAVLLGLVIARLFVVEIWNMSLAGRVVTFFIVGALLVSTAFIGRRKNESSFATNNEVDTKKL